MKHMSSDQYRSDSQEPLSSLSRFDWGDAIEAYAFYGRQAECLLLEQWILQERCKVVSVLGMGGIGKSTLAVAFMHQVTPPFQAVAFRSIRNAPSCQDLLADCLQVFLPQPLSTLPTSSDQYIDLLIECFQTQCCLLVLDNLETVLQEHDPEGRYRPGYEDYAKLLNRVAQTPHQSCLLITSREAPAELEPLESSGISVRELRLKGLESEACEQLFTEKDLVGTVQDRARLAQMFTGNPLALKVVAETISELFGGEIASFLEQDTVIFSSIRDLLAEQWIRLSALEQALLIWLAIMREPLAMAELQSLLIPPIADVQVHEALNALQRRSLVEQGRRPLEQATFTLQSVVLEYVTEVLVESVSEQIEHTTLDYLIIYALEQARVKEYVRQMQERLIVAPIILRLQSSYKRTEAIEELLLRLLNQLRTWDLEAQGYGPTNLIMLLRSLRGHLRGLDLSHLFIRGAYLQGVEMHDTSLAESVLRDTVLTETLDATWVVTVSRTGKFWAAGSWRGQVRVWREDGQRLLRIWQAHTDNAFTLDFSPDERMLATGSWDGTVKLWDLQSGALLWMSQQIGFLFSVAFSPDGKILASSENEGIVRLWDIPSGKLVQTLENQGCAVYAVTWNPNGHLLASGDCAGNIHLWQIQPDQVPCKRMLAGHTNWIHSLAFSPDGTQLASGSWDNKVKIWDVASGCVLQTLTGHKQRVYSVAWSPDSSTLASASFDKTILLWDVVQKRYRAALYGHTGAVYHLAFTPEGNRLLSGSEDSTIRVWNVQSGLCMHIMQGYACCIYDLNWQPDGTHLVSGSTDGQVIVWEVSGKIPPRVLGAHHWIAWGVDWSPDGQLIASSGWDNTIRLWKAATGNCLQILRNPDQEDTLFHEVAWSPDGHLLACGSYRQGIHVWDITTHRLQIIGGTSQVAFRHIAWSPDGTRLASGNTDGSVCLWDITNGTLQMRIPEHHKIVASVAWSPDGTRLVSAGRGRCDGELFVWDVQNGKCVRTFAGHPVLASAVTWDLSGTLLVSGGSDGFLRWWNVASGECIRVCQAHEGIIQALRRSPDGRWLASGADDGAIRIWDLYSGEPLRTLRRDRPYERLNITGIQGLTEAQKSTLRSLGAIEDEGAHA